MQNAGSVPSAMILGAGLGTRLKPLTDLCAKPMVPVGDAPAVAHVMERVRLLEPRRVVVNVHHRPAELETWAAQSDVLVSHEPVLLGTAGGIAQAAPLLGDGDVLVWNGDILSTLDPRELARAHAERSAGATLAVLSRPAGQGTVGLSEDGRVVRLRGEVFGEEQRGGWFLGIHVVGERLRSLCPCEGCIIGDVYLPSLRRGEVLRAHETTARFVDIGTTESYLAANAAWLAARSLASWAHRTARVNADIADSVIGAGAVVDADARGCVVWPNAHVREPCAGIVVTA